MDVSDEAHVYVSNMDHVRLSFLLDSGSKIKKAKTETRRAGGKTKSFTLTERRGKTKFTTLGPRDSG